MPENMDSLRRKLAQAQQDLQAAQARVAEMETYLSEERPRSPVRLDDEVYRHTLDNMLEGCQIIDFDWRYLYLNDVAVAHSRQSRAQLLGHTMMERFPGIEATELFAFLQRCMTERAAQNAVFEFTYPDGVTAWFESRVQPVPEGIFILTLNITERKQSEDRLRESEARYRLLAENVTDVIVKLNPEGIRTFVTPSCYALLGYTQEELLGRPGMEIVHPDDRLKAQAVLSQALESSNTSFSLDQRLRHKAGHYLWVEVAGSFVRDPNSGALVEILGVVRDITGHKRAEEALNASIEEEREFQRYLKALHEITIELTQIDQLDIFYRRAIELGLECLGLERMALFLYDPEDGTAVGTWGTDMQGKPVDESHMRFVPPDDGVMAEAFRRDERFYLFEGVLLTGSRPDGGREPLAVGWNAAAVLWNGAQNIGWLVADNAISHKAVSKAALETLSLYALTIGTLLLRKQTEVALRESEERFRQIADNMDRVLFVRSGDDQKMLYVNPAYEALTGRTRETLYEQPNSFFEAVHPDDRSMVIHQTRGKRNVEQGLADLEFRIVPLDGHIRWVRLRTFPIKDDDGSILRRAGLIEDITGRKLYEETLERALTQEKELSELKSRFVSMASHEFRTPLATILALTETIIAYRHKLPGEQIDLRLGKIQEQVEHLKDIMEDVLLLARMQARRIEFNPVRFDLDSLCRSVLDEFRSRPDVTQQLHYRCDDAVREVTLDKKLIRQILSNLVSNAIKYSSDGRPVAVSLERLGDTLLLKVRDEGIGIPEADQKHLFEPFHRAANVGAISGTGLGLVITKESVDLHGGTITIESQVSVGTTITVSIPIPPEGGKDFDENPGN